MNINTTSFIFTSIFLLLFSHICSAEQPINRPGARIVAKLGDHTISIDEFQKALIFYRKGNDMKKVLETLTPEGKERILNELVETNLLAMEAKDSGLDKEPQVLQAIQNATNKILAAFLVEKEISRLDLSEAGMSKYYEENTDLFRNPDRIKARHINTRSKEEAEAAMKEIRNGRDFAEVATERNIDSSKSKGGDLGWVVKGIMVKPFEDALFSLEKEQKSDIIKTSFGYHIIKVEEIDKGKIRPFETVREDIKKRLIDNHISQFKEDLKKKYPVYINTELLQKADR